MQTSETSTVYSRRLSNVSVDGDQKSIGLCTRIIFSCEKEGFCKVLEKVFLAKNFFITVFV